MMDDRWWEVDFGERGSGGVRVYGRDIQKGGWTSILWRQSCVDHIVTCLFSVPPFDRIWLLQGRTSNCSMRVAVERGHLKKIG
ncbi:hypothetical protein TNCT_369341 [Trichonephila clavata]|uniref:Uncharacterized protein n=1 Tax=Trichonephila clavata TaxID=2740835 RepID=A0A8X6JX64_TRICU|nr:hypothetical protein TNCT_369341 [Trichonephila clavata]